MHEFFDFLGTPTGSRVLSIVGNLTTIVAAVISGKALQNTVQIKNVIGGVVRRPFRHVVRDLVSRKSGVKPRPSATLEEPVTLTERIDGLKTTYERNWVQTGIRLSRVEKRLDRVDPRRKALNDD